MNFMRKMLGFSEEKPFKSLDFSESDAFAAEADVYRVPSANERSLL